MADRRGRLRRLEDGLPRRRPQTFVQVADGPVPKGYDPREDRLLTIVGVDSPWPPLPEPPPRVEAE